MGRVFLIDLEGDKFTCKHCQAHLALFDDLVSKPFDCGHGDAYLFDKVVNVTYGEKEKQLTLNGADTIAEIFCVGCGSDVGCKYEATEKESEKFSVGKFALKSFQVLSPYGCTNTIKLRADGHVATYMRRQGREVRRPNLLDELISRRPPVISG